jgi:phosphoribosylaminoimidazole-succinocarboxamide synthase
MPTEVVLQTDLPLPRFGSGKVRDTYDLVDRLLMVTTDRISAFDCVFPSGIPHKGRILTQLSAFWFAQTTDLVPNHLLSIDRADLPDTLAHCHQQLAGRFMIVRKAQRIDFECVARGYLAGSSWLDYRTSGAVCGIRLPAGLRQFDRLSDPIFTPAAKAATGHDQNVSLDVMRRALGEELTTALVTATLAIYARAARYALERGIIIADTKLEFGLIDGQLILIDEVLTPDSSRFWSAADYVPGTPPASFDKQFLRDYVEATGWNKQPPAPVLPDEIVAGTAQRYAEALAWLTGAHLPD